MATAPKADELPADLVPEGETPAGHPFQITLPSFEGPLELLLHLIREHKLDILDIPISLITEKYLEYLQMMEALDVDVAAEFLVMAATLAHIKSRMLLPREDKTVQEAGEEAEGGDDPRGELVRRLLEYQKYRHAGETLGSRALLGRDAFVRPKTVVADDGEEQGFAEVSVFKLIESFDSVLRAAKIKMPHEVVLDRLSLSDAILGITDRLRAKGRLSFWDLLEPDPAGAVERHRVVIVFLALLEMAKLRLLRLLVPMGPEGPEGKAELMIELREEAN